CSRVLQFATISFDASFHEIFSALLSGGTLFLVDRETRGNIAELLDVIGRNGIKTVFLPMSFLNLIFSQEEYISLIPSCIKYIVTAGEQVIINNAFREYLRKNQVYLHNHYGPSETHVVTTLTLDPQGEIPHRPAIGKPILNTTIYILDKEKHLVPPRVPGELYIGGKQVGRGYLGKENLTTERFIPGAFVPGETLYRSGDLARWLWDGNIEFLGRIDHQVKIRGFRVELGEIESHLLNHPDIKEAVVLVGADD
ncbi:MAG: AMP-binding protein, partial [bacterium]|nr:AMP-binding protein [bacterium]